MKPKFFSTHSLQSFGALSVRTDPHYNSRKILASGVYNAWESTDIVTYSPGQPVFKFPWTLLPPASALINHVSNRIEFVSTLRKPFHPKGRSFSKKKKILQQKYHTGERGQIQR